jgi:hypothetical protein
MARDWPTRADLSIAASRQLLWGTADIKSMESSRPLVTLSGHPRLLQVQVPCRITVTVGQIEPMSNRIEIVDGDVGWRPALRRLEAVWPPEVVAMRKVQWKDQKRRRQGLSDVTIVVHSVWSVAELAIGTPLPERERLNGNPFKLN